MDSKPTANEKPTCHVRRHLTPSQFMTYDAMRAMAKKDDCGDLICYARVTTIVNHTSIGKTQNGDNVAALVAKGWLIPEDKVRWRAGRWANNRYIVLEHDGYEKRARKHQEPYNSCPPFKFDAKTGENLQPDAEGKDFVMTMAFRRWVKENRPDLERALDVLNVPREEWEAILIPPKR